MYLHIKHTFSNGYCISHIKHTFSKGYCISLISEIKLNHNRHTNNLEFVLYIYVELLLEGIIWELPH